MSVKIHPYLKPCPFCGCPEVSACKGRQGEYRVFFYVECDHCAALGPPSKTIMEDADGEAERGNAAELWNRRQAP